MASPLEQKICHLAEANDQLTYAEFVDAALYDCEHGYYTKSKSRVGKDTETDFYTSYSLGPLFGKLVTEACINLLGEAEASEYNFVEIAAEPEEGILQGIQHPFSKVRILRLGDPIEIDGPAIVFANEWLDAQPFNRIRFREGSWRELGVKSEGTRFEETELPKVSPTAQNYLKRLPNSYSEGYKIDLPTGAESALLDIMTQPWHGLFLTLDYGKTLAELLEICPEGTARAYYRHQQSEELLSRPGEQDLTCHLCWDWIEDILKKQNFFNTRLLRQESLFMRYSQETIRSVTESNNSEDKGRLKELLHPAYLGLKFQALYGHRLAPQKDH